MTNIFDERRAVNDKIKYRAEEFVHLAAKAINGLNVNNSSDEVPSFIDSYHGFHTEVYDHETREWIDNPHYNPKLSNEEHGLPENREKQTGFLKIDIVKQFCNIKAIENQDVWEDWGAPEEWSLNSIPLDLFLNGTEEQIIEHFEVHFKDKIDKENRDIIAQKWSGLAHYNLEDIRKFQTIMDMPEMYNDGYFNWKNLDKAIEVLEAKE